MENEDYKVSSELYTEYDYTTDIQPTDTKNVVSIFAFKDIPHSPKEDSDGDLDLVRRNSQEYNNTIEIEHSKSTHLNQVGLQIWRGALLLADWLIHNGISLPDGLILELGSGVGLTSIIASLYKPVICTDINVGGLISLIENNIARNSKISKNPVQVSELDFTSNFSKEIDVLLPDVRIILAADVIYDDTLTDAFIQTIGKLLAVPPRKTIYVALEKRYVFTIADLETCAPCYEYFKDGLRLLKAAIVKELPIDFPQYFKYDRCKDLVLWKVTSRL